MYSILRKKNRYVVDCAIKTTELQPTAFAVIDTGARLTCFKASELCKGLTEKQVQALKCPVYTIGAL